MGDLLDEIRFAIRSCGVSRLAAYRMVTTLAASILRLEAGEGSITVSGLGDLIAVRDTGQGPADRLETLSMQDVEFVMIGGHVRLVSEAVMEQLPLSSRRGLEPLSIDGTIRWLYAPVKMLLRKAEAVLGKGEVRLGGRALRIPADVELIMSAEGKKWHFGVLSFSGTGHLNPFIALCQELVARGHAVTFLEKPRFENRIRQAGFNFVPIGEDKPSHQIQRSPGRNPTCMVGDLYLALQA